ncbi:MAG: hypothetical protein DRI56_07375 [Chloroflexota bacterium]|nr:MAG: hypothetical protein DRI56_07375 [Chloroflexota bacterium]
MANIKSKFIKSSVKFFSTRAFLILLGFCLVAISIFLWKTQETRNLAQIISSTESKARHYASETEIRYNNIYKSLGHLASRSASRGESDTAEWAKDAIYYIDTFTGIKSIAWVDETYHIRQIVPLQDNLPYMNQSASAFDGNPSDVNLWVPVYDGEEFKGYILGTIAIDIFISPVLSEINDDYMLQLSDEGIVIFTSANWKEPQEGFVVSKTITFENTTVLNLTFAPTGELLDSGIIAAKRTLFFSLLFSLITLIAVYFAQKYSAAAAISESHYRDLFDASQDAIFMSNRNGKFKDANPAAMKMVGYSLNELQQMGGDDLLAPTEILPSDTYSRMLAAGGAQEISLRHKDGQLIAVDLVLSPIREGETQKYVLAIARDITDRVKAEEEKRQMEARLRQAQKLESIGTLASGVAHEINNPIMGIMNYAQLIHDRIDPAEGRLREFSAGIIHETKRVAKIVHNLLTFSRQEKYAHSPARMIDIVEDTLTLIRTIIKKDQITLEVDIPDDLPTIKCRSQQIQQVLMNLLTNARDALNQRYPEYDPDKIVSVMTRLLEKDGRRWLRTTVEDHGVGVPEEVRERIFDPFFTTKDRAIGTGLGLSISLGIVQDHHGQLTLESEEGQPTRFHLDLPVDNGWDVG